MEEFILKGFELGALGLISLFLLTRGMTAIKDLSESNRLLADAVTKLSEKVNSLDSRVNDFERRIDATALSSTTKSIYEATNKLSEKINDFERRMDFFQSDIQMIHSQLDKIQSAIERGNKNENIHKPGTHSAK